MIRVRLLIGAICCALPPLAACAADPAPALQTVAFRGQDFLVRSVDPRRDDLRLFWNDDHGKPLHDFITLKKFTASQGGRLLFAANAGMFDPDFKPVGLLVQDGAEKSPLNLNDGAGNFYMKPN